MNSATDSNSKPATYSNRKTTTCYDAKPATDSNSTHLLKIAYCNT